LERAVIIPVIPSLKAPLRVSAMLTGSNGWFVRKESHLRGEIFLSERMEGKLMLIAITIG
jgi:hypothetical protein